MLKRIKRRSICTVLLIVALFIAAQRSKKPKHPSAEEWVSKTLEHYSAFKMEKNSVTGYSVDEP